MDTHLPPARALAAAAFRSRAMADFCALPPPIVTWLGQRARTRPNGRGHRARAEMQQPTGAHVSTRQQFSRPHHTSPPANTQKRAPLPAPACPRARAREVGERTGNATAPPSIGTHVCTHGTTRPTIYLALPACTSPPRSCCAQRGTALPRHHLYLNRESRWQGDGLAVKPAEICTSQNELKPRFVPRAPARNCAASSSRRESAAREGALWTTGAGVRVLIAGGDHGVLGPESMGPTAGGLRCECIRASTGIVSHAR